MCPYLTYWSLPPTAKWCVFAGFTKMVYSPTFLSPSLTTASLLERQENTKAKHSQRSGKGQKITIHVLSITHNINMETISVHLVHICLHSAVICSAIVRMKGFQVFLRKYYRTILNFFWHFWTFSWQFRTFSYSMATSLGFNSFFDLKIIAQTTAASERQNCLTTQ